jgi:hypothetical protein
MSSPLRDVLVRAALEPAFRQAVLDDPARALEGLGLSDHERDALTKGDERVLALLGLARDDPDPQPLTVQQPLPTAQPVALPEVCFVVRVMPSVVQTPAGLQITCNAAVQPFQGELPTQAAPVAAGPVTLSTSWGHQAGPSVDQAAARVHDCTGEARTEALAALVHIVCGDLP